MGCIIEPAINVYSKEEYLRRILIAKNLSPRVQFDVIDGVFAQPGNFNDADIVKNNLNSDQIDLHFMVINIEKELDRWIKIKPHRINLHLEYPGDLGGYFKRLEENNIKKGLAVAPFTSMEKITPYVKMIDYLLLMSVVPGRNGQQFIHESIERIKVLRLKYSQLDIGVDGGVRKNNLFELKTAGVSNIVMGSAIFDGNENNNFKTYSSIVMAP